MSHQELPMWNPLTREHDWVDLEDQPHELIREWPIQAFGEYEDGYIRLYKFEGQLLGGFYLESKIGNRYIMSVQSAMDQWGTWYDWKMEDWILGDRTDKCAELMYPQQWDTHSFHYNWAEALLEFTKLSEPHPTQLERVYTPNESSG